MKKSFIKAFIVLSFSVIYGLLIGIGAVCFSNLLGSALALAAFGDSMSESNPRLTLLFLGVGFFFFALFIATALLNVKKSKKLGITKLMCVCEVILSLAVAIPARIGFDAENFLKRQLR